MSGIHYIQITDNRPLSPLREKCMDSVRRAVREGLDTYELVTLESAPANQGDIVSASDRLRMDRAMTDPHMCYVDTDCFLVRPFVPPENGLPFMALYEYSATERPVADPYLFYVNGRCDWFRRFFSGHLNPGNTYGYAPELLMSLEGFGTVPPDTHVHCYLSMSRNEGAAAALQRSHGTSEELNQMKAAMYELQIRQTAMTLKLFERLGGG